MESTLGDQVQFPDPGVGHHPEHVQVNQEDDFDFEIGGDDGLDLTEEAETEGVDLLDPSELAQDHVDQQGMYQLQEQESPVTVAQNEGNEGPDDSYRGINAPLLESEHFASTTEFTQDPQTGFEVADQEVSDKNIESFSQEENYYEETVEDFEVLDDSLQQEPVQDHDLMNNATSVDEFHAEDDFQEVVDIADVDQTETGKNAVQEFEGVAETVQNVETLENLEPEDATQIRIAAVQTELDDPRDDTADATLANDDTEGEAVAQSPDQSDWNEENDHDDSNASPIVTVSYRGQEYSMFAQAAEDDPDTYFLDNINTLYQPLSEFLENLRQVISSEIEAGHELFVRIDGLGLEFRESTAKDFVDQTTLAQIIEVNDKLSQNDGGSQHAELYIYLSARSNPVQRFAELAKGAEEGHGLSYFEQYYEESPDAVSLFDDDDKHELSQDVDSDPLSPEEASGESEQVEEGTNNLLNAEYGQNPVQSDDQQLSLHDVDVVETAEAEAEAQAEAELVGNTADGNIEEAEIVDANVNGISDDQEVDDTNLGLSSTELQDISKQHIFGDAVHMVDQVETEMGEEWEHDEDIEVPAAHNAMEAESPAEQTELLIHNSEEGNEHNDGENPISMSMSSCLSPCFCVCNKCLHSALEDIDGKADQPSRALPVPSPRSTDTRSFLLSDADWYHLTSSHQPKHLTAANTEAQDMAANMPNDEDYLDLGQDADDQSATIDTGAAEQFDIEQRITPNSSATATLNGEENGQGNEAIATQELADLGETPSQQQHNEQNEDDEIDWNHEDDKDVGVADQSPTDLSPSSLSAKRSRQEDGAVDGLGEDSGMFSRRYASRVESDSMPAAKRRRT